MKGNSESQVRAALTRLGEDMPLIVYKPPDDARNRKPADFMVWAYERVSPLSEPDVHISAFLEVKSCDQLATFPLKDLRPQQRLGIREAMRVGVPYWLVVYWKHPNTALDRWTVSDAAKLMKWIASHGDVEPTSVHYQMLTSRMGVSCRTENLPGTLGAALRGEIG